MKKNNIYKSIMWIIALIPSAITAVILPGMPEKVPMHFDINGNADRWGSKYEELIIVITLIAMTLFMHFVITFFEKKAQRLKMKRLRQNALPMQKSLLLQESSWLFFQEFPI